VFRISKGQIILIFCNPAAYPSTLLWYLFHPGLPYTFTRRRASEFRCDKRVAKGTVS